MSVLRSVTTPTPTPPSPVNRPTRRPSAARSAEELRKAKATIQEAAGVDPKPYFRPPFGNYDASVLRELYALG
jgi:peptidoglycan/xylan/chitin deacetylase (PgdA/CDA1 family)